MNKRFLLEMLCYLALAVMAGFTLRDWPRYPLRSFVWVVLGALALKSWIAASRRK